MDLRMGTELEVIRRKQNDTILPVLKCKVVTKQQEEAMSGKKEWKRGKCRKSVF